MALTKVTKTGITDNAIDGDKIEDGTVVAADIAPGTISSDKIATGTIANDKLANSSVTINSTAVSLGGSLELATGTDWQAVTVADGSTTLNAEAGKGYFLDTNAGIIEVFLPSSPTRGDKVILADYSGTFGTNQIIINTGGELLDSTAGNDFKVTTNNSIVELVYVDSAKGWLVKLNQAAGTTPDSALTGGNIYDTDQTFISATGGTVTESGDYKIHTFTGDGCFVVSTLGAGGPCAQNSTVDYLVVAGGGTPAGVAGPGGGGAGGFRESKDSTLASPHTASPLAATTGITVSATTYPITVGSGGSNSAGSTSTYSTITSAGGGVGGGRGSPGGSGGSGGGGGDYGSTSGGSGNSPPVSPPQGNPGGNGTPSEPSGGGGGAGGAAPGSNPGPGTPTGISGSDITYAIGGNGEGGNNSNLPFYPGVNKGYGAAPGSGNSGVVIIRYKYQ